MWQLAFAAAVAGSGLLTARLFTTNGTDTGGRSNTQSSRIDPDKEMEERSYLYDGQISARRSRIDSYEKMEERSDLDLYDGQNSARDSRIDPDTEMEERSDLYDGQTSAQNSLIDPDKEIEKRSDLYDGPCFKFSSSDRGSGKSGEKKGGRGCGGNWGKAEGGILEKKKSGSGKGFGVCVKKRRISKFGPGKCDYCSTSKGNSFFSQGIGVGIMCMMSAGKAEINKLNAAMDETSKVVHELKTELSKRKASHDHQVSSCKLENNTAVEEPNGILLSQSSAEFKYNVENHSTHVSEKCQIGKCILSEEPQGEATEMDLLEAELESELQKLSWSSDDSAPEERKLDTYENDVSTGGFHEQDSEIASSFLSNGVMPSVLNQKLCNLLIKQQEGQIEELESELYQAQSKLHEREAELQELKDCVRRMSQFSIANPSGEETEEVGKEEKIGTESSTKSRVGMKRSMSFGSYSCHAIPQSI